MKVNKSRVLVNAYDSVRYFFFFCVPNLIKLHEKVVAGSPKITLNWAKCAFLRRLSLVIPLFAANENDTSPSKINVYFHLVYGCFCCTTRELKWNLFSNHFIGSIHINTHIWTWLNFNCDRAVSIRWGLFAFGFSYWSWNCVCCFFRSISDTNIVMLDL